MKTAKKKARWRFVLIPVWFMALVVIPAGQAAEERITFGYSSISPDMAGVWMAKETGAFESIVIQALVAGSVHAGLGASNAVVAAILKGAPIVALASDTSRPSMSLWVQPDIVRPEQLEGKTVAITRYGSTTDFIGRLMLKKIGLEGKVNLRPFGGGVEADVGFRSRQADGRVSTQSPGPQARKLVDGADLQIAFSSDFLAVGSEFYKRSPKSVEGIMRAYVDGVAGLRTRKQKALEVLGKYLRQRSGSPEIHYEYILKYFDRVPRVDPAAVETIFAMLGHSGPAPKIFDNSIIDKLVQEGFTEKLYR